LNDDDALDDDEDASVLSPVLVEESLQESSAIVFESRSSSSSSSTPIWLDEVGSSICLPAWSFRAIVRACLISSLLSSCRRKMSDNARRAPVINHSA